VELPAGEIHVWQASLETPTAVGEAVLSADERRRFAKLRPARSRRWLTRSRVLLRHVLASYVAADPADLVFDYGPEGKPALVPPGPDFNLSHAGRCWLLAVAADRAVGIDVERIDRPVDLDGVAGRIFARGEAETLSGLPATERREGFFRCWTAREAIVKARGEGMFSLGEEVEVEADPRRPLQASAVAWSLVSVPVPAGWLATLAAAGAPPTLRHWLLEA
jgi:4'-phosphopantetheinyl transferase